MSIDFNSLNLEIIDVNINATPDIYFNTTGITFTKRVLEELGYPAYVQFCTDVKQKVFAIRVSRSDSPNSTPFSKPRNEQKNTLSTGNKNVWEPVRVMMEGVWHPKKRYRVTGFMMEGKKTLVFDLSEGVEDLFRAVPEDK